MKIDQRILSAVPLTIFTSKHTRKDLVDLVLEISNTSPFQTIQKVH